MMLGIRGTHRPRQAQRLLGFGSVYVLVYNAWVACASTVLTIEILSITYVLCDETDKLTAEFILLYICESESRWFFDTSN